MNYILYNLRLARLKSGMSQRNLSHRTGISQQTISYWERGEGKPSFEDVIKISKATKVSLKTLAKEKMPEDL